MFDSTNKGYYANTRKLRHNIMLIDPRQFRRANVSCEVNYYKLKWLKSIHGVYTH